MGESSFLQPDSETETVLAFDPHLDELRTSSITSFPEPPGYQLGIIFTTEAEQKELKELRRRFSEPMGEGKKLDEQKREKNRQLAQKSRERKRRRQEELLDEYQQFEAEIKRLYELYDVPDADRLPYAQFLKVPLKPENKLEQS